MEKQKMTAAQQDGVQYRRAKTWCIALSQLNGAGKMCFYILLTYATYIGNLNFGILAAVTGVIITASRIFDGITDPICAYIFERFNSRFGKVRIFMMLGWGFMALATTLMCNVFAGKLSGVAGIAVFVLCYGIYILGYTFSSTAGSVMGNILSDDPRQRPTISVWSTIYSYLSPMIMMMVAMVVLLPRYDNIVSSDFLSMLNIVVCGVSLVMYVISCIGITPYDKPENYLVVKQGNSKNEKPGFKDMLALVRGNKELQRYLWAVISDKLANNISSVSVVTVMLYGIMIGNYSISTTISTVAMLPGIIFAIIGARLAGKHGNKKVMVDWTWVCIILNVLYAAFLLFTDTTQITRAIIPSVLFFVLTFGGNAARMVVSTASNSLRMDIVDYEFYRSGKYMPATVAATCNFIEKLISSLGVTISTAMIGLIGYTDVLPQTGDPLTTGVKVMTVILLVGFPILGWICTVIAMKKSELSREKMVEVQRTNKERTGISDNTVETAAKLRYAENLESAVKEESDAE